MFSPGSDHLQEKRISEVEKKEILENFDKEMEKGPNAQGLVSKIKFTVIRKASHHTSIQIIMINLTFFHLLIYIFRPKMSVALGRKTMTGRWF